jgi:tetratricopeptide (TPR) repeat protein
LHGRIAATLERRFPDVVSAQPELLAQHFAAAGRNEKAVGYWFTAGQQAIARCAMTEAVAHLSKGLDLLSQLPDSPARKEEELSFQTTLGHALMAARGLGASEAGDAFTRARQLCEQLDLQTQLGSVLIGLIFFRLVRGEIKQAAPYAEQIRHLGETQNDLMWKCLGAIFSGAVSYWLGNFIDARSYFEEALPLWNPSYRAVSPSPDDSHVVALIHLSRSLVCLGHLDQARLRRDEAVAEARRLSPYNVVFVLGQNWAGVDWAIGGVKSARTLLRMAEEVLTISNEQGFPLWSGIGHVMRGWCLSALEQAAEGIPQLRQGIADLEATGCKVSVPACRMVTKR